MGKPGGKRRGGNKKKNHTMGKRWKTKYERLHKDIDEVCYLLYYIRFYYFK